MVKFDRSQVCDILEPGDAVEITVAGVGEGFRFVGTDTIRIISEGKRHRHQNAVSDLSVFASTASSPHTGTLYFYHLDHLGTPQAMTDENGEVVWKADYQPFGEADVTVGDVENKFRFPGQYYDAETELHYNWHRYYDPKTGRYLRHEPFNIAHLRILSQTKHSKDRIKHTAFYNDRLFHPALLNPYGYSVNNPGMFYDPDGNIVLCAAAAAGYITYTGFALIGDVIITGALIYTYQHWIESTVQPDPPPPYQPGIHERCMLRCKIKHPCNLLKRAGCYTLCVLGGIFDALHNP